ncbi:LysR family transcriptional regulator [Martelella lutilitoris]|uniref:LysR family transcriptional regulator n=1 Tax=Martelella lutilitoris TaxID=2583532 RepID=A0A5C4JUF6_9HYPH|nr:LysR family transcriptional regulator [Martelella lutilitoris]TNB48844.1 LysR family transcriptional regulator [Martelella lutilitoris]
MRLLVSRHLENFLALYEAGNMRAAAQRKGVSQPALTKSLQLIENELDVELFERTHKGLVATETGHILYRHACAIEQEARFAALEISHMREAMGGRIKIGVGQVLAVSIFPALLADFHRRFPNVEASVEAGISNGLLQSLMRDNLDFVIAALPEASLPDKFVTLPLLSTDMVIICSTEHPLCREKEITAEALTAFRRVGFLEDREFESRARQCFGNRSEALRPILQTTSLNIMFGLLTTTDYYAIVSDMIVPKAEREGLAARNMEGGLWTLDVELICKASLVSSKPISAFKEAFSARTGKAG